jgi:hypothetical protein
MALLPTPTLHNVNPLASNGFQFTINKIPEISYFSTNVNLPDISLPAIEASNSFSKIYETGDTLDYSDFTVNFIVDEDLGNYLAIYKWMVGLGFPENYTQFNNVQLDDPLNESSDGALHILSSSNNIIRTILFHDMRPVFLGGWEMNTTSTDVEYITCSATFRYHIFTFDNI